MPEHTPAPTPHRAVYGFSFYLLFLTLFVVYVLWALLPSEQFSAYLPDKYFAIALPMLALSGLSFFVFIIYPAIGLSLTPNVDDLASVVDPKLALRGCTNDAASCCLWEKLAKDDANETDESVRQKSGEERQSCAACGEQHKPSGLQSIATLRFVDLGEINKEMFR